MKINLDSIHMNGQNAHRGIGMYTACLKEALTNMGIDITSDDPDLVHYPYFDLFFHTLSVKKDIPTVVTVHDVIPLIYKYAYPPGIKGSIRFFQQLISLRSVAAIITDSACSKKDICKHLGVDKEKVFVTLLAGNPHIQKESKVHIDSVKKKYNLPKTYVLYIGDMNYNKNLPRLISACSKLSKEIHLVLVGRSLMNTDIFEGKQLHNEIMTCEMENRVHILNDVPSNPSSEMASIITGASVYIQPSLYEGFGLPVLDAMQCEVVVVSSNTSSLPEVCGDAALYFNPTSIDEMHKTIQQALTLSDEDKKVMISKGVTQAKKFSWVKTAEQTIAVYKKVLHT